MAHLDPVPPIRLGEGDHHQIAQTTDQHARRGAEYLRQLGDLGAQIADVLDQLLRVLRMSVVHASSTFPPGVMETPV